MELYPTAQLIQHLGTAAAACRRYVARLPLPGTQRRGLVADVCRPGEQAARGDVASAQLLQPAHALGAPQALELMHGLGEGA